MRVIEGVALVVALVVQVFMLKRDATGGGKAFILHPTSGPQIAGVTWRFVLWQASAPRRYTRQSAGDSPIGIYRLSVRLIVWNNASGIKKEIA